MNPSSSSIATAQQAPGPPSGVQGRPVRRRFRATLTKEQASLIYALRPPDRDDPNPSKLAGNSQLLAKKFGVSPKAVRDVWNRRTWAHATKDAYANSTPGEGMDSSLVKSEDRLQDGSKVIRPKGIKMRSPGRPIGSKDSKPRRRRATMKNKKMESDISVLDSITWPLMETSESPTEEQLGDDLDYLHSTNMTDTSGTSNEDLSEVEERCFPFFLSSSIVPVPKSYCSDSSSPATSMMDYSCFTLPRQVEADSQSSLWYSEDDLAPRRLQAFARDVRSVSMNDALALEWRQVV
eukprot:243663-Hanusia_phi.AAC.1